MLVGLIKSLKLDELAAAMLKTATEGGKIQIMENSHLKTAGHTMLKANAGR
jgi:hypothetical protein